MERDALRATGVWYVTDGMAAAEAGEFAAQLEQLGYSALWIPDSIGRDPFAHLAYLATQTSTLRFATGIASIFNRHPGTMKQAWLTLGEQTNDRFVLGLGVSHQPIVVGLRKLDYSKPRTQMQQYLSAMDESQYRGPAGAVPPRLLAALGPRMLETARDQADGAHPYFTTPEHTAAAREILGPDKLLCVEQKVALTTDPAVGRERAAGTIAGYARLPNYRNNWLRLGYTEDEIEQLDPRFVDAVVAWGDADAIRRRVQDHYDAGADHVCIQPLGGAGHGVPDWDVLESLAPTA
ncbi:MAG: TIGR03620 family F420-dependent LLM class oxidoreductase [Acidimicrobiia bacterium]